MRGDQRADDTGHAPMVSRIGRGDQRDGHTAGSPSLGGASVRRHTDGPPSDDWAAQPEAATWPTGADYQLFRVLISVGLLSIMVILLAAKGI